MHMRTIKVAAAVVVIALGATGVARAGAPVGAVVASLAPVAGTDAVIKVEGVVRPRRVTLYGPTLGSRRQGPIYSYSGGAYIPPRYYGALVQAPCPRRFFSLTPYSYTPEGYRCGGEYIPIR